MNPADFKEESVPMSNETRGHAIKRRRVALGITSLEDFAKATGVSRQAIARAEKGDERTTETTYQRLEAWLENEMGDVPDAEPAATPDGDGPAVVEYRLSGDFGVDLVVKGPVSNIAEMEASIGRLMGRMRSKDSD